MWISSEDMWHFIIWQKINDKRHIRLARRIKRQKNRTPSGCTLAKMGGLKLLAMGMVEMEATYGLLPQLGERLETDAEGGEGVFPELVMG